MAAAALWGLLASSSLLVGAIVGLRVRLSEHVHGLLRAFGAGGILAMLADTMTPEAYDHGGRAVGLVTVPGFAVALALSEMS